MDSDLERYEMELEANRNALKTAQGRTAVNIARYIIFLQEQIKKEKDRRKKGARIKDKAVKE